MLTSKLFLGMAATVIASSCLCAQVAIPRNPMDIPGLTSPKEPAKLSPMERAFSDRKYKVRFQLPAGWDFEKKDGFVSTFSHDTRDTTGDLEVRGVAAINYNPYPPTTFSGALFYYSVKPKSDEADCAAQARVGKLKPAEVVVIDGVRFNHGKDEYGVGCVESRDHVYTTLRGRACVRFDLVINTFCQQTSGNLELSGRQLGDIQARLAKILGSVRFDKK